MLFDKQSEAQYADIILPLNLPQTLTYGVPLEMHGLLQLGIRVEVPLGRNKQYSGIVARIHNEKPETYNVKPVRSIIDDAPVVSEVQLRFWKWISWYYMAGPGEVMQAALPAHLKLAGETRIVWTGTREEGRRDSKEHQWTVEAQTAIEVLEQKKEMPLSDLRGVTGSRHFINVLQELLEAEVIMINDSLEDAYKPKRERVIILAPEFEEEETLRRLFGDLERAPKQLELLMTYVSLAAKSNIVSQAHLLERSGGTSQQIKALADKGIFYIEEREVDRLPFTKGEEPKTITFTPAQQQAYDELADGLKEKEVALLEGVTGSGKTLLYIHQIKACHDAGKQAILLLPEIGLTTQLVSRLYAYFGDELGVYHSRFSNNERVEIWEKVKQHKYKVIVGPRSVLWLPYDELGLIIVDEEHDPSYKQRDPAPRFHARDTAIYLASLHNAKVILGSATPSVESLYNAQHGKYAYALLAERYKGVQLPQIAVVNAKSAEAIKGQGPRMITPELQTAITETLQQRKQVILFQNRRGYSPFQLCTVCGWVPHCTNCAVSLTYHKSSDKLLCHYCGLQSPVIYICPSCGTNKLQSRSFGTERIEEEVQQIFPEARIARMDVDTMRAKQSMPKLLEDIDAHRIDILVGTQMVVKGLDFAQVSLVGILSADSLLSYPDFRVNERAFQLMEQVSGRAGRADGAGKVVIQAFNGQHPVLGWVQAHDVRSFYDHEIRYREFFGYPPFSRLIKIAFKHPEEEKAVHAAHQFADALQQQEGILVQGPVAALIARVRGQYIQEVWLKCPRDMKVIEHIKSVSWNQRQLIGAQRGYGKLIIVFDVDPV